MYVYVHSIGGIDVVVPEFESQVSSFVRAQNSVSGYAFQALEGLSQIFLVPKCQNFKQSECEPVATNVFP